MFVTRCLFFFCRTKFMSCSWKTVFAIKILHVSFTALFHSMLVCFCHSGVFSSAAELYFIWIWHSPCSYIWLSGATNGENDYETELPDFDPIKHHNNFCPWVNGNVAAACCINSGSSTELSGWQLTVDAIETLQSLGQAQNQTMQSDSAASLYKVRLLRHSNYPIIFLVQAFLPVCKLQQILKYPAFIRVFHPL